LMVNRRAYLKLQNFEAVHVIIKLASRTSVSLQHATTVTTS
jgi:hypothetical protein